MVLGQVEVHQRRQNKRIISKGNKGFRGSMGGFFEMERKCNFVVSVRT